MAIKGVPRLPGQKRIGRPPGRTFDFLARIRFPQELWDAVKVQGERCGESPSSYVRIAVGHRLRSDALRREQDEAKAK